MRAPHSEHVKGTSWAGSALGLEDIWNRERMSADTGAMGSWPWFMPRTRTGLRPRGEGDLWTFGRFVPGGGAGEAGA
ncbi:MAG: hypothetical protein R3185_08760, partial [Candidatus Thermoplasmatota archaeon]|nr:hypothetical protein [Candidatus Thermoplasmatota archaeon]